MVRRWTYGPEMMEPREAGMYVRFSDYAELQARLADLEKSHDLHAANGERLEALAAENGERLEALATEDAALQAQMVEESRRHMEQTAELVQLAEDRRVRLAEAKALLRGVLKRADLFPDDEARIDAFLTPKENERE